MKGVTFYCPRWGAEDLNWVNFLNKVKSAGYDGIEIGIAERTTTEEMDLIWMETEKRGLSIIIQHYETCDADFSKHYDKYAAWFQKIRHYKAVKINSQTGKDFFSHQQNKALIDLATVFSDESGTAVFHETHRGKFSFAAHITEAYLRDIPQLRLTLDISHWVCVAETFLADQQDAVALAIQRTGHLHARVGYPQGPQISDPRIPEWQEALGIHLNWWDQVVDIWKKNKESSMTITPEFGPKPYMVRLPDTQQPISDQWAINKYMMDLLRDRYQDK